MFFIPIPYYKSHSMNNYMNNYIYPIVKPILDKYPLLPLMSYNGFLLGKSVIDKYYSRTYTLEQKCELITLNAFVILTVNYGLYRYFPNKYFYTIPLLWGSLYLLHNRYFPNLSTRLEYEIVEG